MKRELFNADTKFENNTYYTFDQKFTDIFLSQTRLLTDKKYLTTCGGDLNKRGLDTAFYLYGLNNVTLDFGGSVITLHGRIQPFIIDKCSNITIKNVVVEYERAVYTELDIIENTGKELRTRPKAKFPCRVENGYFIPYAKDWENKTVHADGCIFIQAYEKESREGAGLMVVYLGEEIVEQESPPADNIPQIKVRSEGEDIVLIGSFPKSWDDGKSIVITHETRDKSSVAMYHSKNIGFENYRILNGAGMGFNAIYTENITLKSARLEYDELSHGTVTNAADGIHFVACKGKIEITDSVFEGTVDDTLNIHSNYYHTDKAEKNVIYARRCDRSHGLSAYTGVFGIGDEIAVYRGKTLEEKARFKVEDVKITGEWTVELTVDRDTGELEFDDLIENLSTNPEVVIKNSRFAKSNANLRLQTRGKFLIEGCTFNVWITLTGDTTYWFEASPINDLTIKDCKFIGDRGIIRIVPDFAPTEAAPFYHSGIKIINNCFDSDTPLIANYATDILFENNRITGSKEAKLELNGCQNVQIK